LLGNHLLDALALGAGVAYGFYGPKAALLGAGGLRRLAARFQSSVGLGGGATGREQRVLTLFVLQASEDTQRLVVARLTSSGLTILAQQDLPAGVNVDKPGAQAQIDYCTKQLLERSRASGLDAGDLALVDPRLQAQSALLRSGGYPVELLVIRRLSEGIARLSDAQRQQLQAWVQQPNGALPTGNPLVALMEQRTTSYARLMPQQQASMALLVELSLALMATSMAPTTTVV
jgi:hypothetical protein